MKVVKVILGVLIALSIGFFSIGLIIKETTYSVEVEINKPITETFTAFNDSNSLQKWIPAIKTFETIEEKPGKIGSEYRLLMVDKGGNDVEVREKVLAFVENQKVALSMNTGDMLKTDDFTFLETLSGTTIKLESVCKTESYLLSCVFPLFKGTFKRVDQENLNNFKSYIENL